MSFVAHRRFTAKAVVGAVGLCLLALPVVAEIASQHTAPGAILVWPVEVHVPMPATYRVTTSDISTDALKEEISIATNNLTIAYSQSSGDISRETFTFDAKGLSLTGFPYAGNACDAFPPPLLIPAKLTATTSWSAQYGCLPPGHTVSLALFSMNATVLGASVDRIAASTIPVVVLQYETQISDVHGNVIATETAVDDLDPSSGLFLTTSTHVSDGLTSLMSTERLSQLPLPADQLYDH